MNALNRFADPFYCIMRLVVGLMFACHGLDKIFGTFTPKGEALPTLMVVGGWVEIVCGFLVALGLLTRIAAFVASGEMAAAFFMMHGPKSLIPYLRQGEVGVGLRFCFLLLLFRRFRRLEPRRIDWPQSDGNRRGIVKSTSLFNETGNLGAWT